MPPGVGSPAVPRTRALVFPLNPWTSAFDFTLHDRPIHDRLYAAQTAGESFFLRNVSESERPRLPRAQRALSAFLWSL